MNCDIRNMTPVMGSSLPVRAAKIDSPAVSYQSRAVECLSSVPRANTVAMTVKISSIMGMKLGAR